MKSQPARQTSKTGEPQSGERFAGFNAALTGHEEFTGSRNAAIPWRRKERYGRDAIEATETR
jgi:hypothetical protein